MENQWAVDQMAVALRASVRVCKDDLFNAAGLTGREAEMALWRAKELVRETDGIVFGVLSDFPRHLHRLDTKQIVRHAGRQRRKGYRAVDRSLDKLRVATETASDEAMRELASRAEARAQTRALSVRKTIKP